MAGPSDHGFAGGVVRDPDGHDAPCRAQPRRAARPGGGGSRHRPVVHRCDPGGGNGAPRGHRPHALRRRTGARGGARGFRRTSGLLSDRRPDDRPGRFAERPCRTGGDVLSQALQGKRAGPLPADAPVVSPAHTFAPLGDDPHGDPHPRLRAGTGSEPGPPRAPPCPRRLCWPSTPSTGLPPRSC